MANQPFRIKNSIQSTSDDGQTLAYVTDSSIGVGPNGDGLALNQFLTFGNTTQVVALAANDSVTGIDGIYYTNPNTSGYLVPTNVQTFLTSGTWQLVPHGTKIMIECYGGGGSGGFRNAAFGGGGGGGGSYQMRIIDYSMFVGTGLFTVTVGAGGTAKSTAGPGVNGGTTFVGNSTLQWCLAGGGCGGGNTGTNFCNGGHGGQPNSDAATPGTSTPQDGTASYLFNTFFGVPTPYTATGADNATLEWPRWGIAGFGGGGGGGNTTIQYGGSFAFGGGAGGGNWSVASIAQGEDKGSDQGPGFLNNATSPSKGTVGGGVGGKGGNTTVTASSGISPGGGGGGGGPGGRASGAGANGMVIITVF